MITPSLKFQTSGCSINRGTSATLARPRKGQHRCEQIALDHVRALQQRRRELDEMIAIFDHLADNCHGHHWSDCHILKALGDTASLETVLIKCGTTLNRAASKRMLAESELRRPGKFFGLLLFMPFPNTPLDPPNVSTGTTIGRHESYTRRTLHDTI